MQCKIAPVKSNVEIAAQSRWEICLRMTSFALDCTHVTVNYFLFYQRLKILHTIAMYQESWI